MAIYVVKVNHSKGTVTVADAKLASDDFTVLGEDATTSSGERPTKIGWFRLTDFFSDKKEGLIAKFSAGTDVSKDIKFGDKVDKSDSDSLLYFVEAN
tara:strand:- start:1230 stop:1520 length:291 start_codon:yes stop_codon:yes gene_type:complete